MSELKIVAVGRVDKEVTNYLAFAMAASLGVKCELLKASVDPRDAYNPKRRQYDSTQILSKLLSLKLKPEFKILGVTDLDLFVPIFTFVFGSAQVDGNAALFSTYRLRQQFYGLPEDKNLFYRRCEKEATHELGHAYGLAHCRSYECVMHFSNSIEQVDLKNAEFCKACGSLLSVNLESVAVVSD